MRLGRVSVLILLLSSLSSAQKAKLDMLDWMTMDPFGSHMSGSGTPMWTVMDAAQGKFYWVRARRVTRGTLRVMTQISYMTP
jgi:hypothetical protein